MKVLYQEMQETTIKYASFICIERYMDIHVILYCKLQCN